MRGRGFCVNMDSLRWLEDGFIDNQEEEEVVEDMGAGAGPTATIRPRIAAHALVLGEDNDGEEDEEDEEAEETLNGSLSELLGAVACVAYLRSA